LRRHSICGRAEGCDDVRSRMVSLLKKRFLRFHRSSLAEGDRTAELSVVSSDCRRELFLGNKKCQYGCQEYALFESWGRNVTRRLLLRGHSSVIVTRSSRNRCIFRHPSRFSNPTTRSRMRGCRFGALENTQYASSTFTIAPFPRRAVPIANELDIPNMILRLL
jgi:hypothetical protein